MPQSQRQDEVADFLGRYADRRVSEEAARQGVPEDFARRVLNRESRKRADILSGQRRSPKGATGPMQLMPGTARELGVDPDDFEQNIAGGVRYLAEQYRTFGGDQAKAAAAYNAGPGAVRKYGGVPPYRETQGYVREVAQSGNAPDEIADWLNKRVTSSPATVPAAETLAPGQVLGLRSGQTLNLATGEVAQTRPANRTPRPAPSAARTGRPGNQRRTLPRGPLAQPPTAPTASPFDFRQSNFGAPAVTQEAARITRQMSPEAQARLARVEQERRRYEQQSWLRRRAEDVQTGAGSFQATTADALVNAAEVVGSAARGDFNPLLEQLEGAGRGVMGLYERMGVPMSEATRADLREGGRALVERQQARRLGAENAPLSRGNLYWRGSEETQRQLEEAEAAAPGLAPAATRGVTKAALGAPLMVGATMAGGVPALTALTAAQSDFARDPEGAVVNTALAGVPIVAGRAVSPLARRAALSAAPGAQKAVQLSVEGGVGGLANAAQYAGTQALLNRKVDPQEVLAQALTGAALSGAMSPRLRGSAPRARAQEAAPADTAPPNTAPLPAAAEPSPYGSPESYATQEFPAVTAQQRPTRPVAPVRPTAPRSIDDEPLRITREVPAVSRRAQAARVDAPPVAVDPIEVLRANVDEAQIAAARLEGEGRYAEAAEQYKAAHDIIKDQARTIGRPKTPAAAEALAGLRKQMSAVAGRRGEMLQQDKLAQARARRAAKASPPPAPQPVPATSRMPQAEADAPTRGVAAPAPESASLPRRAINPADILPAAAKSESVNFEKLAAQQAARGVAQDNPHANKRLIVRIRELGGLNPGISEGEAINARQKRYPGLINRKQGRKPDELLQYLEEDGYPVDRHDLNTLWRAIDRDIAESNVYPVDRRVSTDELTGERYSDYLRRQAEPTPTGATRAADEVQDFLDTMAARERKPSAPLPDQTDANFDEVMNFFENAARSDAPVEESRPQFVIAAERRLQEAATGQRAGSGGQQLADLAVTTGYQLYRAGMDFAAWARAVVKQAGAHVRPYLREAWERLQASFSIGTVPELRGGTVLGAGLGALQGARGRGQASSLPPLPAPPPQIGARGRTPVLETISALRKAGLLTSPKTHAKNLIGNTLFQVSEEVARMPAALADIAISAATGRRTITGPSAASVAKAGYEAATKGIAEAKEIIRNGVSPQQLNQLQLDNEINSGSPILDAYINGVFRTLAAEDRVFRTFALRRSLEERARAQALTEARQGQIKRGDVRTRTQQLVQSPPAEMEAGAIYDAEVATFTNDNLTSDFVSAGRRQIAQRRGGRAVNFLVDMAQPFVRTPANIIARTLEYTPLGYVGNAVQVARAIADRSFTADDQRAFARTFGRATTGTGGPLLLGYMLAANGLMTGAISDRPEGRERDKAAGRPPMAIRNPWTNTWHQVGGFAPIGTLLGLGASLYEATHRPGKESSLMGEAVKIGGKVPLEQPLLDANREIAEGLEQPQRGAAVAGRMAGSFIPTIVGDVAGALDDRQREARGFTAQIQKRVPLWRESLPVATDALGRPLEHRRTDIFDPTLTRTARERENPLERELIKHGVGLGQLKPKRGETAADLRARTADYGQMFEEYGRLLADDFSYTDAPAEVQRAAWRVLGERLKRAGTPEQQLDPEALIKAAEREMAKQENEE